MGSYIARRVLYMVLLALLLSVVAFIVIQLPPGDYVDRLMALRASIGGMQQDEVEALRAQYGLDLPLYRQYLRWLGGALRGNLGPSFGWGQPVIEVIKQRLPVTIVVSVCSLLVTYLIGMAVGIYSATHQYSFLDHLFTGLGFVGLGLPNFLLAIILLFLFIKFFGISVIGLFSPEFMGQAWSLAKFLDLLKHLPIPVLIIALAGTAGLIRVMRGTLLDELRRQYVITARAKGLAEGALRFKYPVRVALNPIVSTMGWNLAGIVSGETIVSIVLTLPTTGTVLYGALLNEDVYLAGSVVMILSLLTLVGTLISDILLVMLDPRIRMERALHAS